MHLTERATALRKAMAKAQPIQPRLMGLVPYEPADIAAQLPRDNDFYSMRLRALVLMRFDTLMRPGREPASIRVADVTEDTVFGRHIVKLLFRSKQTMRTNVANDTQHVNHAGCARDTAIASGTASVVSDRGRDFEPVPAWLCPACAVLQLAAHVRAHTRAHDTTQLFCDINTEPITASTCCSLVKAHLNKAGVDSKFTAHSLRMASNTALTQAGVDTESICVRAGWATQAANRARITSYSHFRVVKENFARILLCRRRMPGTIFH